MSSNSLLIIYICLVSFSGFTIASDELISEIAPAPAPALRNTLVLANSRTRRPDILNGFKIYNGGWNVTNRHYWSSVGFTGAVGFIPAFVWFIGCFGFVMVVCCWWQGIQLEDLHLNLFLQTCLLLLLVFTFVSVIGAILLSVDQDKLHKKVGNTMNYVMNQSNYTVQTLKNVTTYLLQAKGVSVNGIVIPPNVIDKIDKLNMELGPAADTLEDKTKRNSDKLRQVFTLIQSTLIAVAGVMPFVSILGLLFSYCGHQHAITIVIFGGWLLVAITFIFFGVSIIFNNVIRDTCMAMEEWVSNSQAETSLSNILPCVDQRMTDKTLLQSKEVINNIVSVVNTAIEYSANFDPSPQDVFRNYNQSGPKMPILCSPFNNNTCGPRQVSFTNASWVWQNYTCSVSTSGICTTVGRITPQTYLQLVGAVSVSYALDHYAPPLLGFQNCNFVKETFIVITSNYCPKLVHSLEMVSIELGIISCGVPVCLVLSVLYVNLLHRKKAFLKNHTLSEDS